MVGGPRRRARLRRPRLVVPDPATREPEDRRADRLLQREGRHLPRRRTAGAAVHQVLLIAPRRQPRTRSALELVSEVSDLAAGIGLLTFTLTPLALQTCQKTLWGIAGGFSAPPGS